VLVAGLGAARAQESGSAANIMKPISGQGAEREGRQFLLNIVLGGKQAVSYYVNEKGRCKVTLMVGDAFNGGDVPDFTTVRFAAAIEPAQSATFDTAQGKSLELTCEAGAEGMSVKTPPQIASN
jgi:hypothetical protein